MTTKEYMEKARQMGHTMGTGGSTFGTMGDHVYRQSTAKRKDDDVENDIHVRTFREFLKNRKENTAQ